MSDKADGRIVIDTEIDVSGAKQGVKNLTSEQIKVRNEYRKTAREIALLREQIKDMETPKIDTSSLEKYETKLQATYDKLADLEAQARTIENEINASVPVGTSKERLQDMYEHNKAWKEIQQAADKAYIEAEKYEKEIEKIKATKSTEIGTLKYKRAVDSLANATEHLDALGKKTKEVDAKQDRLVNKLESVGREGKKGFKKASSSAQKFAVRLRSIIASAFIFNVISSGLRRLTSYMGNALKRNKQFSDSVSAIKGNLLTAFQPVYDAVMPALNIFMAGLQKVTGYIASFMNMLFGTSIKASQESAKELYEQASALDSVSDSAKKANKQLSSIDELHVVNKSESIDNAYAGTGNNIVPSFGEIETIDELPEWLQKCLETIKKLIEDWKIGDFFSVGEDVSDLVIQINEFVANAIANVNWEKLGKNVGAFLRGIKWLEVLKSIGDVIGAAIDGAIDFWFGAFSEAPFETALITAMALWSLTGVGNFLTGKINNALGTSLPANGFSIKSALKVIFELLLAFKIGDKIGSELAKLLDDNVANILGEDTFFDYVFKFGVSDGLKELGSAFDEMMTEFVTGIPSKVTTLAENINSEVEKINLKKIQLEISIENIDKNAENIQLVADAYYNLSQNSSLSDEDLQKLNKYKEALEEFGINVGEYINPETNAWIGAREALDELISSQKDHLKLLAYQDAIVDGEKALISLEKEIANVENEIGKNASYQRIIEQIQNMEDAGYSLNEVLNTIDAGKNSLEYKEFFGNVNQSDAKAAAKLYQSLRKVTTEYKNQEKYVSGLYAEVDILNGNVNESNELVSSGTTQLERLNDVVQDIDSSSKNTTSNIKRDFTSAEQSVAGGVVNMNSSLNKLNKNQNLTMNTSQAEQSTTWGVANMNNSLGRLNKNQNLTMNTTPAINTVQSTVPTINKTLGGVETKSINIETSTALSKAEILRNNIEAALSCINIGLEFQLQAKVNDAIATSLNIGQALKMKAGEIKAYRKNSVPYLASGAVIPPNKEFMAVLGDQKHGMNIEAPADLIKQMVKEGIAESGTAEDKEINVYVYLEGDAEGVFNMVKVENDKVRKQTGNSALV